ncbi:hypothetical protein FQN57_002972 [Myotisia sp. PD_48]|nr:hypothetical protein FQN57_002972 [Myotisia sp. PD_48]
MNGDPRNRSLKDELGPGDRVPLGRVAVKHLQRTSRPLRLAVDVSIWLFQVQAGQGGYNPALRTLFFRLARLISLPIHPIFVFDGPNRPKFKRGKLVSRYRDGGPQIALSKKLIELFAYPYHTAPGEAEAECAKLQSTGIVDAVITNDVDALMFGSKNTMLNFSKEAKQSGAATHVDIYRTEDCGDGAESNVSMDTGAMVLFALLSGGDYSPAGVAFCGRKLAGEIARAGFGSDLLEVTRSSSAEDNCNTDSEALHKWRERLQYELITNESGYFKTKHKAVKIPDDFPDTDVLRNCVQPLTSSTKRLDKFRNPNIWNTDIDVKRLREFVDMQFGWDYLPGAKHFIRNLAPAFLNRQLLRRSILTPNLQIPVRICGKKSSESVDGLPVLKLEYLPLEFVGLNLDLERIPPDEADATETEDLSGDNDNNPASQPKKTPASSYDPYALQTSWVPEALVRCAIPKAVDSWFAEEAMKAALKAQPKKRAGRKPGRKVLDPTMKAGAIRQYGTMTKTLTRGSKTTISKYETNISSSPDHDNRREKLPSTDQRSREGMNTSSSSWQSNREDEGVWGFPSPLSTCDSYHDPFQQDLSGRLADQQDLAVSHVQILPKSRSNNSSRTLATKQPISNTPKSPTQSKQRSQPPRKEALRPKPLESDGYSTVPTPPISKPPSPTPSSVQDDSPSPVQLAAELDNIRCNKPVQKHVSKAKPKGGETIASVCSNPEFIDLTNSDLLVSPKNPKKRKMATLVCPNPEPVDLTNSDPLADAKKPKQRKTATPPNSEPIDLTNSDPLPNTKKPKQRITATPVCPNLEPIDLTNSNPFADAKKPTQSSPVKNSGMIEIHNGFWRYLPKDGDEARPWPIIETNDFKTNRSNPKRIIRRVSLLDLT